MLVTHSGVMRGGRAQADATTEWCTGRVGRELDGREWLCVLCQVFNHVHEYIYLYSSANAHVIVPAETMGAHGPDDHMTIVKRSSEPESEERAPKAST